MRSLRNMVSAFYPSTVLLCSSANEDDTEGCIEAMGRRLAKVVTVKNLFQANRLPQKNVYRTC